MTRTVTPGTLRGSVTLPPAKSCLHRLMLASYLAGEGEEYPVPADACDDIAATRDCLRAMRQGGEAVLPCRASGSTLRFLLPAAALSGKACHFTGDGRLFARPSQPLLQALRTGGADILETADGITVKGPLHSGDFTLPGNISSQYFTGLLMALPLISADSRILYRGEIQSRPYVDMTLKILEQYGVHVREADGAFMIPGNQRYRTGCAPEAEPDLSLAAVWKAANRMGSHVRINGLPDETLQADGVFDALADRIGGEIDVRNAPDLFPVLCVCAAAAEGKKTRFTGIERLRYKESDRVEAVMKMLRALGIYAEAAGEEMTVCGGMLRGGTVDSCFDHRIVMSAALAGLKAKAPVRILCAEAARKSYPAFWQEWEALYE